jgi:predicted amidohydrolase YtcJ
VVVGGTDAPVEAVDPIPDYHAAVTRQLPDGSFFFPEQDMTREEALRSRTLDAAFAAFEEDIKGSLEIGKLADVTVLSKDVLEIPADQIPDTRVLYTIVGGKVRYRAN